MICNLNLQTSFRYILDDVRDNEKHVNRKEGLRATTLSDTRYFLGNMVVQPITRRLLSAFACSVFLSRELDLAAVKRAARADMVCVQSVFSNMQDLCCWMEVSEMLAWGMALFTICSQSFANLNEETGNYEIPTMYDPNEHFIPPREPAMPLMKLLESWSENRLDLMMTRLSVAQRFFKSILEHVPEDSLSSLIQQICIWNVLFSLELGGYHFHAFNT